MDPFTISVLFLFAGILLFGTGLALLFAPERSSQLLNEWFAVIPVIGAGQRARLLLFRVASTGIILNGVTVAWRAVGLFERSV